MGTIHTLPTDKPSRLITYNSKLKLVNYLVITPSGNQKHIYITSDEEIKEEDWVLYTKGIKIHCQKLDNKEDVELANIENSGVLKIILTTDQELIQDDIQAIDDEFLEWFVKNPSCKEIKIGQGYFKNNYDLSYKIIIQKEEHKHPKVFSENGNELFFDEQGYLIKEEPKQETLEEDLSEIKNIRLWLKNKQALCNKIIFKKFKNK